MAASMAPSRSSLSETVLSWRVRAPSISDSTALSSTDAAASSFFRRLRSRSARHSERDEWRELKSFAIAV
jgi:hypothetical protein